MLISANFESKKNTRAFLYTLIICIILIVIAFFITWSANLPPNPVTQDLLEVNLGNNEEGYGEVQPLIKGEKSPQQDIQEAPTNTSSEHNTKEVSKPSPVTEDNDDKEAAGIERKIPSTAKTISQQNTKEVSKNTTANNETKAPTKPQNPKFTYNGPANGTGNGATEDNGYNYQGNKAGGKGDAGSPNGNPDSYGNNPGGNKGGSMRVTQGDRKIVRSYSFTGDLDKATIYATIKVSPAGRGQFVSFAKNSSSRNPAYKSAIADYLTHMQFDKADHESIITVQFNFMVN